ncbi:choline transporter-like protein 2 isoform X2 [Clupea harengus]|uniref:Choline transporter-like protein 2 n=1 Tax=Clupea harengus TaxID=7950 RepID=A0A6P8F966_CLUHA|nr:choline transporter-like protein 2 isoform X2 [Clupea harengus]
MASGDARKFDPTFKGPIHNRGCTDILCCILFILAILGYFAVGILAWSRGDPRKVIYPTDSRGQFCGQAGTELEKKPLLFYFNIMKCASPLTLLEFQCPTPQICVDTCPNKFLTLANARLSSKEGEDMNYYKKFCKDVDFSQLTVAEILRDRLCPGMLFPSRNFSRRCLPDLGTKKGGVVVVGDNTTSYIDEDNLTHNASDLLDAAKKSNIAMEARQIFMRIFEDYTQSWHFILIGLVIAMVVSLIFIVLLRFLAGIMVWVMMFMVILVILYGIVHCYLEFAALGGTPGSDVTIRDLGLQTDFSVYLQIRQTWLAFMIILAIVEVVIIILLIFLRKRILIAIALIKEASRAIGHVMSSLVYPLITFFLLSLVIAYWGVTAVFLSTSNEAIYKVFNISECSRSLERCDPKTFSKSNVTAECPDAECQFAFYGGETLYHKYLIVFQFYNLFLFFWCANFVTALGQVTLAGAFASFYWAFKKPDDMPAYPIFASLGRALRYHTGSLAFGSLILSIVQVIRVVLEYLDQKLKGAQNKFAKFLLTCLKCCFWCLEKCIKFLNRNAYIMVAIYGKNFCTAAKDAFFLLMRNIVRVAVLDKVTDFLLFLGKLLIVGIVGICSFFFFSGKIKPIEDATPILNYYWVPILTIVFGSYLIAHGFFSVYAMCVDTLFLCFCEDLERNDGSTDKPYFMSKELHEILSKIKPDEPDEASPPAQVQADEETPLQQEDGEIQVKQETVLRTENEEEQQPLNQEPPCQAAAEESEPPQDKTPPPQTPQEPETQTAEPQTTPLLNGYLDVEPEEKNEPEVTPQPGAVAAEEDEQDEEEKPKENGPLEIDTPLTPQD